MVFFLKFLTMLKNESQIRNIEEPLYSIETSINDMKVLINKLGDKIIGEVSTNLEDVRTQQDIENLSLAIASSFNFCCTKRIDIRAFISFLVDKLFDDGSEMALKNGLSDSNEDLLAFYSIFEYDGVLISNYNDCVLLSLDTLKASSSFKQAIIDRLLKKDYLNKMKLT